MLHGPSFRLLILTLCTWLAIQSHEAAAADTVTVRNNMEVPVYYWLKSEEQRRWPDARLLRVGRTDRVPIYGPDRFLLVIRDLQGAEYHEAPIPLRQYIQADAGFRLSIDGLIETRVESHRYWSPRWRRWYTVRRQRKVRTAVIFRYTFSDGTQFEDYVRRSR